jgi:ligand-binding sensor domain-containing protein
VTGLRTFDENDFLASEVILSLTRSTRDGRLWAGTMEGLGYVAADEWHGIKGRDGGLTDRVLALRADTGGRMWGRHGRRPVPRPE